MLSTMSVLAYDKQYLTKADLNLLRFRRTMMTFVNQNMPTLPPLVVSWLSAQK
jgi:hypothetical protein